MRSRRAGGALLVAALAGALPSLDTSVNIALPAITDAFHLDVGEVSWIVVSYVLTYSALLLGCGRLADRVGHRRVLLAGLLTSLAGLSACAAAPTFPWLVAARTLQGAGAGLVLGAAPALVTLAVPPGRRSRALATFQLCTATGFALGPPIGGLVLGRWSWPAVWWYRVPVALVLLGLVVWVARADRHAAGGVGGRGPPASPGQPLAPGQPVPLDLPGVATLAVALAGLLLALSRGRELGWTSPLVLVSLAVGMVAAGAFVAVERRSPAPILDLSLLRRGGFALANALNLAANASWFVVLLLVPYYLLTVRGLGHGGRRPGAGGHARRHGRRRAGGGPPRRTAPARAAVRRRAGRRGGRPGRRQPPDPDSTPMVAVLVALAVVGRRASGSSRCRTRASSWARSPARRRAWRAASPRRSRTVGVLLGVAGAGTLFEARTAAYDPPAAVAGDPSAVADARFMAAFRDVFLAAALTAAAAGAGGLPPARERRSRRRRRRSARRGAEPWES